MARTLSPEEMEDVRTNELASAAAAASRARTAQQPGKGFVKLYDPHHDAMTYGQVSRSQNGPHTTDDLIVFGGVEAGVAIVRADHPLLPALRRRYPGIKVMEPGEALGQTYACPECDATFTTKRSFKAHFTDHAAPPSAPADATLPARKAPRPRVAQEVTPEELADDQAETSPED